MPKELNLTPPLVEAQKMIADFLSSVTHAELDLNRLSKLIEVGQQQIERGYIVRVRFIVNQNEYKKD